MPHARGVQPAGSPRITMVDAVTNSSAPAPSRIANRYGAPKRALSKRAKYSILAVVATLSLAWVLWVVVGGGPSVTQKVLSYHVTDSTLTTVEMTITKDPDVTAQCAVQALNSTYAIVGWDIITVAPSAPNDSRTTTVNAKIRTSSLAVTGVADNCWVVR